MTQQEAFELLKCGHNACMTGPAGSGKTYLLNQYIEYAREKKLNVAVTASTGIAATHMNGMTIHSWSGLGVRERITSSGLRAMEDNYLLRNRVRAAHILIIDEISMLHAWQLDAVDQICQHLRDDDSPFGGLQVLCSGDFFQLPPVQKKGKVPPQFAVASDAWQAADIRICYLDEQHRHADLNLSSILNEIRENNVSAHSKGLLMNRQYKKVQPEIIPPKLYIHNADVELDKIKEQKYVYLMHTTGPQFLVDALKKSCLAPEQLEIKKGAAVMFVKNNFKKGYVNGTLGKVVAFDKEQRPIVRTFDGRRIIATPTSWAIEERGIIKAEISQIPLRLAWAITVHKSQGMTLDAAEIDLSKSFVEGMGYVALSRVRTLAGLKLMGINELALQVNPSVIELDHALRQQSQKDRLYLDRLGAEKEKLQREFLEDRQPEIVIQV